MTTQTCKKCSVVKPLAEFYKTTDRKSGYKTICKECIKADPLTEQRKKKMREYGVGKHLKAKYNLSIEDRNNMLIAQNHKCAICGVDETIAPKKKLVVDHCHKTKKIRGLLCHNCNVSIGLMKESIPAILNSVAYLNAHIGETHRG